MLDLSLIRKLWEGEIAAKFTLAQHEVKSTELPLPFFLMLPRNSYFPLMSEKITKHFLTFTDNEKVDEIWFEFKGQPLKWHLPIGVLFDLLVSNNNHPPWEITIHFQDFPNEILMRCPHLEAAEASYMSALKEADQLKHRGQVINSMNKNQHKQLWHSLRNNNFEQFWLVNKTLMEGYDGKEYFKSIPLKLYYNGRVIQKITSSKIENKSSTLLDAIRANIPECNVEEINVITQGIMPPLNSELQWLGENLCCPDNFLHVILN